MHAKKPNGIVSRSRQGILWTAGVLLCVLALSFFLNPDWSVERLLSDETEQNRPTQNPPTVGSRKLELPSKNGSSSVPSHSTASSTSLPPSTVAPAMPSRTDVGVSTSVVVEQANAHTVDKRADVSVRSTGPVDTSVVGIKFPVSPSLKGECAANQLLGRAECEDVWRKLAAMDVEPRASIWADEMEAKIRAVVTAADPEKYSIRALECRTSTCALEITMINTPHIPTFDWDFLDPKQLFTMELSMPESVQPGKTIGVGFVVFYPRNIPNAPK
jgi:hypothetical protein